MTKCPSMSDDTMRTSLFSQDHRPKTTSKLWILYACVTAVLYCSYYSIASITTREVKAQSLFYGAAGALTSSLVQLLNESRRNRKELGTFRVDFNLVVNKKLKVGNLIGMLVFSLLLLASQIGAVMTLYTSGLAQVNEGVVATVYSLEPLIMTIADRFLFGTSLKKFHYVGLVCILVSSLVISFASQGAEAQEETVVETSGLPSYVPVVVAVLTAFAFCAMQLLGKHLT